MSTVTPTSVQTNLAERFRSARRRTLALTETLTPEDMMVQSCPEASPVKWHLAHTSWFFESFILREFVRGYHVFNPDFTWLFNSYYQSFSVFPEKRLRSSFSRPGIEEILRFRAHVDEAIERMLEQDVEAGGVEADRTRRQPRRAAPGTGADRHSARVLHQSSAAGICSRHPGQRKNIQAGFDAFPALRGRHAGSRACRRRILLRQRTAASSRVAGAVFSCRAAGDLRRICRIHGRRRLSPSGVLALGRMERGQQPSLARARSTGRARPATGRCSRCAASSHWSAWLRRL